jgi:hypothetical protein
MLHVSHLLGLSNEACAERYLEKFTQSSRTKQSLKTKFQQLRVEAVSKFQLVQPTIDELQQIACFDFLTPGLITTEKDKYYVHALKN